MSRSSIIAAVVNLDLSDACIEQAKRLLKPAEHQRIARLKRDIDRRERTLAYVLHRSFLASIFNISLYDIDIARHSSGAPQLATGATSLSHTAGWAAFAYAEQGPVGIDIELKTAAPGALEIRDRIVTAEESQLIDKYEKNRQSELLLRLWVKKEAALKAAQTGLEIEMPSFACPSGQIIPLPGQSQPLIYLTELAHPECVIAVAGLPGNHVICRQMDWASCEGPILWL